MGAAKGICPSFREPLPLLPLIVAASCERVCVFSWTTPQSKPLWPLRGILTRVTALGWGVLWPFYLFILSSAASALGEAAARHPGAPAALLSPCTAPATHGLPVRGPGAVSVSATLLCSPQRPPGSPEPFPQPHVASADRRRPCVGEGLSWRGSQDSPGGKRGGSGLWEGRSCTDPRCSFQPAGGGSPGSLGGKPSARVRNAKSYKAPQTRPQEAAEAGAGLGQAIVQQIAASASSTCQSHPRDPRPPRPPRRGPFQPPPAETVSCQLPVVCAPVCDDRYLMCTL